MVPLREALSSKAVRLRVSGCSSSKNSIIATDNFNDVSLLQNARFFGSACYEMMLFAAGKLDKVYLSSLNYTLKPCFELVVRESGGISALNGDSS